MFIWQEGELNEDQDAAVCEQRNVFLVACPGSGKTRALTYKIALELSLVTTPRQRVVAITYTNRAANEIQDRIESMGVSTDQLWIGTIHAFCLEWIIKPYGIYHEKLKGGFRVVNSHDTENILTDLCAQCPPPRVTHFDCDHYYDSTGINIGCTNYRRQNVENVLQEYQRVLEENQQIDFEHILWYSFQLIQSKPTISILLSEIFNYILIDEYQDTKEIQYQIFSSILKASEGRVKAFIVGDPNQSIFTSLGGYAIPIEELVGMSGTPFQYMELSKNYRNSSVIIDYFSNFKVFNSTCYANGEHQNYSSLISYNTQIRRESLINEIARIIRLNVEQHNISTSEICVIGPWWIHLAALTRGLVGALPDYRFDGPGLTPFVRDLENFWYRLARIILTKPSPHTYIKRLRWAGEVIQSLQDAGADVSRITVKDFLKIINKIEVYEQDGLTYLSDFFDEVFNLINIEYTNYPTLHEHRAAFFESSQVRINRIINEGVNYAGDIDAFYRAFESRNGITVSTIHGVKGAEFDSVIAFALLDGAVPHFNEENQTESANKLLYVICSRARKHLHLISEIGRNQANPTRALAQINYQYTSV